MPSRSTSSTNRRPLRLGPRIHPTSWGMTHAKTELSRGAPKCQPPRETPSPICAQGPALHNAQATLRPQPICFDSDAAVRAPTNPCCWCRHRRGNGSRSSRPRIWRSNGRGLLRPIDQLDGTVTETATGRAPIRTHLVPRLAASSRLSVSVGHPRRTRRWPRNFSPFAVKVRSQPERVPIAAGSS